MINQEQVAKLLDLSDAELKQRILTAAAAAGADTSRIAGALNDTQTLRNVLSGLSQNDLDIITQRIGKDKAEEIAKTLRFDQERP